MAPAAKMDNIHDNDLDVIGMASAELESLRGEFGKSGQSSSHQKKRKFPQFPAACMAVLKTEDENNRCMDCGAHDPQWASVSFGALLCLQCSGVHRSLGVQVSCVRSISMDEWSIEEVVAMLEGGNAQLTTFFTRHALSVDECRSNSTVINKENVTRLRYKTKAAEFYRQQMELHVCKVIEAGPYRGKEVSRSRNSRTSVVRRNSG